MVFVKVELSHVFSINLFTIAENWMEKWIILWKQVFFSIVGNYLRPSNNYTRLIFNFDTDNLLRFTKLVKCMPEF